MIPDDTPLYQPEYSVGGFYDSPGSGRESVNFNVGWRFFKGANPGADESGFDDNDWPLVNLPHGLEILPLEASGGVNYQGEAWYRKHFDVPRSMKGKRIILHFEGLMGKSNFWVNGTLVKEHVGGFLPAIVDVTEAVAYGAETIIAVQVDNSDDPEYPPGKPQSTLDFAYFGGIYRDVWLVTTDSVHITDPNEVDTVAGGGVFVHYKNISEALATVCVATHIINESSEFKALAIQLRLLDCDGKQVAEARGELELSGGASGTVHEELVVTNPHLWHVDDPSLHTLEIEVQGDQVQDGVRLKVGIRSIEFRGKDGFFLNGKPFDGKLIGSNRHQDYAYVGNALPNNVHWRDAVKHRQAGMRVIRCAHYPQDPAFMDACDALGMFVIITTPGWQFWNDSPIFEERVYSDIRNMVRRDRNRPSVFLWEPILNETNYPDYFAKRVHEITHEEYPHDGCYTACDGDAAGQEHFDVVYGHTHGYETLLPRTDENLAACAFDYSNEDRCVFTREWGDCVADWRAQSSPSRVNKGWGERAQLIQAKHYSTPDYVYTCYDSLCGAPAQHVGGTLWHGIDHQRGYHADAFWGGFLDATRQPKFSYYMFRSQVPLETKVPLIDAGPYVRISHLVHPSSESDVTVFSNCQEVRLKVDGHVVGCQPTSPSGLHMPHVPVVFEKAFQFYRHGQEPHCLEAEGLINGEVVATFKRRKWDRRHELVLEADVSAISLQADGSDFVPVVARIVDKRGEVVRLTDDTIRFTVDGPGEIIGDTIAFINPQTLCWGESVILVRAGCEPGTITVCAESAHPGVAKPLAATISINTVPAAPQHYTDAPELGRVEETVSDQELTMEQMKATVTRLSAELTELKLRAVEQQQEDWM